MSEAMSGWVCIRTSPMMREASWVHGREVWERGWVDCGVEHGTIPNARGGAVSWLLGALLVLAVRVCVAACCACACACARASARRACIRAGVLAMRPRFEQSPLSQSEMDWGVFVCPSTMWHITQWGRQKLPDAPPSQMLACGKHIYTASCASSVAAFACGLRAWLWGARVMWLWARRVRVCVGRLIHSKRTKLFEMRFIIFTCFVDRQPTVSRE